MERPEGFADLNIPTGPNCQQVVMEAVKCGYKILAINTTIQARYVIPQTAKKTGKKRKWDDKSGGVSSPAATTSSGDSTKAKVPKPPSYPWLDSLRRSKLNLRILHRLTITFAEISELQSVLTQPTVKDYELIAVLPTNHDAMQACITSTSAPMIFDIISFDMQGQHWINKLRLNRTKGDLADSKDIVFEITYASSLHGDEACGNMIYTANCLLEDVCVKKIKNIIITSGATAKTEVKAPKDVSILGYLIGMSGNDTMRCIREHTHRIVSKSDARAAGRTWVEFRPEPIQSTASAKPGVSDDTVKDNPIRSEDPNKEEPVSPDPQSSTPDPESGSGPSTPQPEMQVKKASSIPNVKPNTKRKRKNRSKK